MNCGEQRILTNAGYIFTLHFSKGLTYSPMSTYYSMGWDKLTNFILTSDTDMDTRFLDSAEAENYSWFDTVLFS